MIRFWDGFLSLLAAMATAAIVGIPLWGCFVAIRAEMIPGWAWAPFVLLSLIGIIMMLAFLRKAGRGVHPMRERRR